MQSFRQRTAVVVCAVVAASALVAPAPDQRPLDLAPHDGTELGSCFPKLGTGERAIHGISFRLAGTRVRVLPGEEQRIDLPATQCGALHFLHYTEHAGDPVGAYVLVFADEERVEIPLACGLNIQDWWFPGALPFACQAHSDVIGSAQQPQDVGFWRFSVQNPRPDVPLAAVEIVNDHGQAVINVIAITLSDTCDDEVEGVPVWAPGMAEEQRWIAVLGQSGPVSGKEQACQQLRRVGTVASVPALAALLGDEGLSHAARIALESMPFPEAGSALRQALGTATGAAKVGIIESLGERGQRESASVLAPSLQSADPSVAAAAALALGKVGGPVAIQALKTSRPDSSEALRAAIDDGLLRCAEALRSEDEQAAHELYADVLKHTDLDHERTAAYRGMVLTAGNELPALVTSALVGEDPALWAAALPAVRAPGGPEGARAFAALIGRVPKAVLPGLLEALVQRGDPAAAPAVAEAVDAPDPAVRAMAVRALGHIGDGSEVPVLARVAAHGEKPDRTAAAAALARLSAPDVLAAMLALVEEADAAETAVLAEALGRRRAEGARPVLRRLARNDDAAIRTAAVLALGEAGNVGDVSLMCKLAARAEDATERTAAGRALVLLAERLDTPPKLVKAVLSSLRRDDADLRYAMLGVCGELRHPRLLLALGEAIGDDAPDVQDAAIRALADSSDPGALAYLLPVSETAPTLTHRVLALRAIARLASDADELDTTAREDALRRALATAERAEEKKLLLSALGGCHTAGALDCTQEHLSEGDVAAEAAVAWAQIAEALRDSHPELVRTSAQAALDTVRRAAVPQDAQRAVLDVYRAVGAAPVPGDQVRFDHIVVDRQFRSEGVAVADVNRDGFNDILTGDVWYAAPDWQAREIRTPQTYDPDQGYSQCFANFAADVDEDGWVDSIVVGFPGAPAFWYRNPGDATEHWQAHRLAAAACGETPIFGDLLGDGRPVPVFALNRRLTWFRPHEDPASAWQVYPVTQELPAFERFGHGLGMGDVNGDGRADLLGTDGWWEAPEDRSRSDWTFHRAPLGPACADMLVYDVDGDGDNDILTSSAHGYGIWWFEQKRDNGEATFQQHEIYSEVSQTHALSLADINSDGLQDLITGKRYHAHNGNDPGSDEPAVVCWLELERPEEGECRFRVHEIDHDSGVGTQFQVSDLDGDGLLDVVTSNKKGVHAFLQRRSG